MSLPVIILLTRPGCHLCEEAKVLLHELGTRFPHRLEERNIDEDPALRARYHLTIPVIRMGEVELGAPISRRELAAALQAVYQP